MPLILLACGLTVATFSFVAGEEGQEQESGLTNPQHHLDSLQSKYVTPWRADSPAGYPRLSASEAQLWRDKGQRILCEIREASAAGQARIIIPPGDYLFNANWSRQSTLKDLAGLEIVAEDVTFWFEPPLVHGLLFQNCRNVTLRGLTIDFTIPCWFQAQVKGIDRQSKTLYAQLMPGYEPLGSDGEPETSGERACMFYRPDGGFINHRHTPTKWQLAEDGSTLVCRAGRFGIPAALKPGDYVVGTLRTGAALRSASCSKMRYENVKIWSSPGMAVWEGLGEGGHVYYRVRATRRPHSNRLHAFGADIFHLAAADRGPTLDSCELAFGADDVLNIHGNFGRVVKAVDATHFFLQGAYAVGDRLEFRDHQSLDLLGKAKVVVAEKKPDGPSVAINARHQARGDYLVELDRPIEARPLTLVVMDGKQSAAGFVVRNSWIHSDFQRTLINGAPGGLIENNTFSNLGSGLRIQFETWGPWMEGPFARGLVVRGNRFFHCSPQEPVISVSMHPGGKLRRWDAMPVTNLTIESNYFDQGCGLPITIRNVDGLRIHGNQIDVPAGRNDGSPTDWVDVQDCANVSIRENRVSSQ